MLWGRSAALKGRASHLHAHCWRVVSQGHVIFCLKRLPGSARPVRLAEGVSGTAAPKLDSGDHIDGWEVHLTGSYVRQSTHTQGIGCSPDGLGILGRFTRRSLVICGCGIV